MTSATEQTLTSYIDKVVHEKTFSLEAVQAINDIKEHATTLEVNLKNRTNDLERRKWEINQHEAKIHSLETQVKDWQKREADLKAREVKITELEKDRAVAIAVQSNSMECMRMMLANRIVRENIQESIPLMQQAPPGGYSTVVAGQQQRNIAKEEG